ncbi:MAG: hypothetical protein U9Q73_01760 [Nanoarchaeota archaeon]|nr:hypothetical protein [Nanoarchaeota archaeon]
MFKSKKDIFRDLNNWPICEDCLYEDVSDYWDDDFVEQILHDIKTRFKGNYARWHKWFYENNEMCDGVHDIDWYVPKSELVEIDGNKYCQSCMEKLAVKESSGEITENV